MKRITLVITLWAMLVATAFAQKAGTEQQLAKEANELFTSGEFLKAYPLYSQLVSLYPQNADYSFRFGACAIYSDPDKTKAIQFLNSATKRNVSDATAWYYLGRAYHLNYQFREAVSAYETFVSKADPKTAAKFETDREIQSCIYGSNLLSNIKDVVVINKTEADKENFFRYMNLEGIGGKILTVPEELQSKLDKKSTSKGVIHYPGNSTTIYFSSYGNDGATGKDIYKAQVLPDGKFSTPEKVRGGVNTKYDEDYCFMHSNGHTLYFASKGHNTMGGYDIFKCELDPKTGSFGPAINLDFAINTPDDDIFYIADSLNQKAYFASGRTSDLNHLHVYNVLVQGIPLQVVYLKGEFVSEIDAEQKNATIQVRDDMSGRIVMEESSNPNSGNYTVYVPKGGVYQYFVKTENSPVIHEAKVTVPSFDKPVALRQELRLVKEDGVEKLLVNNYFDEILDEDISALAAEMLRKKAGLEVTDGPLPDFNNNSEEEVEYLSVDKTIENAPLAAGFGEGQTAQTILADMKKDAANINAFVAESDKKYNNAYAYALNKQKEAEELTNQAEQLKASVSGYMSDEDVKKLRESQSLLGKAEALKIEARGAILAAENVKSFKESEAQRALALEANIEALENGLEENNFNIVYEELKEEKDRIVALRAGTGDPLGDLKQKATSKESSLHAAEDKLLSLRKQESDLQKDIAATQNKIESAKKKSEKEELQASLTAMNSDLESVRRKIIGQNSTSNQLGKEAKEAVAAVALFQELSTDSNMGLTTDKLITLDDAQRSAVAMKVDALETRFDQLRINDDKTLAILGSNEVDESKTSEQSINITSTLTEDKPNTTNSVSTEVTASNRSETSSSTENSSVNVSIEATTPVTPVVTVSNVSSQNGTTTPSSMEVKTDVSSLKSQKEATLAALPANSVERKNTESMVNEFSMRSAESRIQELQKKRTSGITQEEKDELQNLISYRNELKENSEATAPASSDKVRVIATEIDPQYVSTLQDIENHDGTELERTAERVAYQKETIEKLRVKQDALIAESMSTSDADVIAKNAEQYNSIESAIAAINNEVNDVQTYRAAFDTENKTILESTSSREKLEDQIELTQSYMNTLEALEAQKQEELALCTDLEESEQIRMNIGEIRKEYQIAETKLMSYESDLRLTANTSEPTNTVDSTTTVSAAPSTLEEIIESSSSTSSNETETSSSNSTASELSKEEQVKQDSENIREIFKARVESESVFAYEGDGYAHLKDNQSEIASRLKNDEKLNEVQGEILMIEAEIETESSTSKQRKLDKKAESLYFKRAKMEIQNAPVVAEMTSAEFDQITSKVDDLNTENQEDLNSRTMLRDEVRRLYDNAKSQYEEAQVLRQKAGPINDDIEKADYYRQAFAKEALAIEMMSQIVDMHSNMDMFLAYSDQELTELRYGNPANVYKSESTDVAENLETVPASEVTTTEATSSNTDTTPSTNEVDSETGFEVVRTSVHAEVPTNTTASERSESTANDATTFVAPSTSRPAASTPSSEYYSDNEAYDFLYNTPSVLTKSLFVRTSRAVYSESKPIPVNPAMPSGVYYCVQIGAFRNPIPQNLFDEFAPLVATTTPAGFTRYTAGFFLTFENADQVKLDIRRMGYSDAFVVAYRDGKRIPIYEAMAITESDPMASMEREYIYGDGGEAPVNTSSSTNNTNAGSSSNTSASAASNNNTSSATNNNGGNNSNIASNGVNTNYYSGVADAAPATQVETVKGLFFTVQVGVYSKPVPSSSLRNISPVNSELTETKKIRYTSGIYSSLQDAVDQRDAAKNLGINDAFITAYYNGKRITLTEADRLLKENGNTILVR
ncbi:MAG: hypothetical protein R2809_00860 [Flavobacteriales bacterium]